MFGCRRGGCLEAEYGETFPSVGFDLGPGGDELYRAGREFVGQAELFYLAGTGCRLNP